MVSAEGSYSRKVVVDVMAAKRNVLQADFVSRHVENEHKRHTRNFPTSTIMDSADYSVHSIQATALRDAIQARLTYGDQLLNRIPQSAVEVYDQYRVAKDNIHSLSEELRASIPQGEIDLANEDVQTFLLDGTKFGNFYQDAEKALKKLGRKLFFASLVRRGTALQEKNNAYDPIGFSDCVTVVRIDLQEDLRIAEDKVGPMSGGRTVQFVQELASLCGISSEHADKASTNTFMSTLGFYTRQTSKGKEIWYREGTPASWLYDIWMKEKIAMSVFKKAREDGNTARAYFALVRVQELADEADSIRSGVIAELKGYKPSYPGAYIKQIGVSWFRTHKVCNFPLDEEKA